MDVLYGESVLLAIKTYDAGKHLALKVGYPEIMPSTFGWQDPSGNRDNESKVIGSHFNLPPFPFYSSED